MKYKGQGFYCKYEGELIVLGKLNTKDIEVGEVWEGSETDYNETFLNI